MNKTFDSVFKEFVTFKNWNMYIYKVRWFADKFRIFSASFFLKVRQQQQQQQQQKQQRQQQQRLCQSNVFLRQCQIRIGHLETICCRRERNVKNFLFRISLIFSSFDFGFQCESQQKSGWRERERWGRGPWKVSLGFRHVRQKNILFLYVSTDQTPSDFCHNKTPKNVCGQN